MKFLEFTLQYSGKGIIVNIAHIVRVIELDTKTGCRIFTVEDSIDVRESYNQINKELIE